MKLPSLRHRLLFTEQLRKDGKYWLPKLTHIMALVTCQASRSQVDREQRLDHQPSQLEQKATLVQLLQLVEEDLEDHVIVIPHIYSLHLAQ